VSVFHTDLHIGPDFGRNDCLCCSYYDLARIMLRVMIFETSGLEGSHPAVQDRTVKIEGAKKWSAQLRSSHPLVMSE